MNKRNIYINKIIQFMKNDYPLIKNMELYGFYDQFSKKELTYVFSGIFGEPIKKSREYIYNQNGNKIYYEDSGGYWGKWEYDDNGNKIYFEDSDGKWEKYKYDENGNEIYYEHSDGFWSKSEYDENVKQIYYENSYGYIEDNR